MLQRRLRRLVRSSFAFWLSTCSLGAVTGLVVSHSLARADAAARRYGSAGPVVVARRPVEPGRTLAGGDMRVVDVPSTFVPAGALRSDEAARGRTVVVALLPGEMVLEGHLAGPGAHGLTALLPAGKRALAVPLGRGGLRVRKGDRVDVLATFDKADTGGEATFPVARSATVIDAGDDSATVAVGPDEAPRVAYAVAKATVALALTGSRSTGTEGGSARPTAGRSPG